MAKKKPNAVRGYRVVMKRKVRDADLYHVERLTVLANSKDAAEQRAKAAWPGYKISGVDPVRLLVHQDFSVARSRAPAWGDLPL